jgi:hypothetical protein
VPRLTPIDLMPRDALGWDNFRNASQTQLFNMGRGSELESSRSDLMPRDVLGWDNFIRPTRPSC